ncbi:CocE/NonD family hydrolase [Nocardia transvalensis]|uniref:CocE/NonD family hydrolase n=1 Tax=Nocardia transvalensis TaxID=37333 RepID=UPI001894040C|nr:CocE/NonD family hydrolase [Nocardia transvalensis]MBF6332227.1 CocE/NonD family hydrolase [Nocardia transvalensis]
MNRASRKLEREQHLSPPLTRDVVIERDLRVPMRDGVVLLADRWAPKSGGDGLPTALVRCPYGRRGQVAVEAALPLAERGFQVLVQSTRGTFGSGGRFDPFRCERNDGLDTLDWVVEQPWFGESMILVGASYLGCVQWAVADQLPPQVKAMIPVVSESAFTLEFLRKDGFALETPFSWGIKMATQERMFAQLRNKGNDRKVARALLRTLPLDQADAAVLGHHDDYIQNCLAHDADDPFWSSADHRGQVADITVPVSMVDGWYDMFVPGQLRDFQVLQKAGRTARITVGPWLHYSPGVAESTSKEALEFGLAYARGEQPPERAPVRLYVMGQEEWRDFPTWPPPGYEPQRYHLQPDGALATELPQESAPDGYHYDPADPTPALGGPSTYSLIEPGRVDNAALEARSDVLTYTTPTLARDVEVIGEVSAEIWFRSSLPHADVFVRLCDVDDQDRSYNVCDGLVSRTDADRTGCATVHLWPTAYRFKRGHRIRVQVSSGAFPRFNRNLGTGEPRATATTLRAADQQVFHDPQHPSAVILPVRQAG